MPTFGLGYHHMDIALQPLGPGEHSFGHGGAGGSLAFADPQRHVSFACIKNQMNSTPGVSDALAKEVYACL
jgi:CubicO group peptidase (beta-lactamase class C family)